MKHRLPSAIAVCLWGAASLCHSATASHPFDGRWSVVLVCPDTQGRKGLVKGYEYRFDVSIREGSLRGEYGSPGQPASLVLAGHVSDDGALDLTAEGNTGQPDYTVGKVAEGTRYAYTMQGRLVGPNGQATRKELRPCTATFNRP